ncbi:MAG: 50S ribosomal protein L17 [Candidatus Dojkabacteria bacterium]|jgi:large subunit ribosomal protein L17|nr:MAG: 50S ribosomal protein L17 [Candidatus Dojkabacteria bacterium]
MYKKKRVRKLGKPRDQRIALVKSQVRDLIGRGYIKTTMARAKEVVRVLGVLAHHVKSENKRMAEAYLKDERLVSRLSAFDLDKRLTGLARMIKIGNRKGDNAKKVLVELVKNNP